MAISLAASSDLAEIALLLRRSGLNDDGLAEHVVTALVARADAGIVGCAALEVYGSDAILRSLAVDAAARGCGLGQRLTKAALDITKRSGVKNVYLLTKTAGKFFPRFGFIRIARTDVPERIRHRRSSAQRAVPAQSS